MMSAAAGFGFPPSKQQKKGKTSNRTHIPTLLPPYTLRVWGCQCKGEDGEFVRVVRLCENVRRHHTKGQELEKLRNKDSTQ